MLVHVHNLFMNILASTFVFSFSYAMKCMSFGLRFLSDGVRRSPSLAIALRSGDYHLNVISPHSDQTNYLVINHDMLFLSMLLHPSSLHSFQSFVPESCEILSLACLDYLLLSELGLGPHNSAVSASCGFWARPNATFHQSSFAQARH